MKNALHTEIAKGEQFSRKAQSDRSKLYDEKKKRQQSNQRAYDKLPLWLFPITPPYHGI